MILRYLAKYLRNNIATLGLFEYCNTFVLLHLPMMGNEYIKHLMFMLFLKWDLRCLVISLSTSRSTMWFLEWMSLLTTTSPGDNTNWCSAHLLVKSGSLEVLAALARTIKGIEVQVSELVNPHLISKLVKSALTRIRVKVYGSGNRFNVFLWFCNLLVHRWMHGLSHRSWRF